LIVESYGNRWIISAEEQGEIEVSVGDLKKYPLRSVELNRVEHAGGYISYEGMIESWQNDVALMFALSNPVSGGAIYFSIVLNSTGGPAFPFDRITRCKLYNNLRFKALNVDWRESK
jgi:hypothetical protein